MQVFANKITQSIQWNVQINSVYIPKGYAFKYKLFFVAFF